MESSLARAATAMKAVKQRRRIKPFFGVGFDDVGEMFSVFTPKRWELIGALRKGGAVTVAELARRLKRDYSNVHNDCERLIEWMAIERDEDGLVFAPWSEIVVEMKLPDRQAA